MRENHAICVRVGNPVALVLKSECYENCSGYGGAQAISGKILSALPLKISADAHAILYIIYNIVMIPLSQKYLNASVDDLC